MPCDFKTKQVLTTDHGALWEYTSLENRSSRSVKESRAIRHAKLQGNLLFSLRELRLIDIGDDKVKYNKPILLPFVVVIYITNSKVPALGYRIICGTLQASRPLH